MAIEDSEFCPRCHSELLYWDESKQCYSCLACEWHRDFLDAIAQAHNALKKCSRLVSRALASSFRH